MEYVKNNKKYTDEQIDAFLDRLSFKPHPQQVKLFKKLVNTDGPLYVTMSNFHGRSVMSMMLDRFYKEMEGDKNESSLQRNSRILLCDDTGIR